MPINERFYVPHINLEVRGMSYRVAVATDGKFGVEANGQNVWADTLDGLRKKILDATKRAKVSVRVPICVLKWKSEWKEDRTRIDVPTVRNGVITGIHAGTNNFLVRWEDGKNEQISNYGWMPSHPLSEEDGLTWMRLAKAAHDTSGAVSSFEANHRFNARRAVEEAIKQGVESLSDDEIDALSDENVEYELAELEEADD